VLVVGLISVAVLTRFLAPAAFGDLAVLLVFSTLLSVLYNIAVLQGAFQWVYQASEDEGGDVHPDATEGPKDRRRALGTAFVLNAFVTGAGTLLCFALADPLGELLLGEPGKTGLVRLATLTGGLGAFWRVAVNTARMERRPGTYALLNSVRPFLMIVIAIPLLSAGRGVEGVLIGAAVGTGLSVVVAMTAMRRSMKLAFDRTDALKIFQLGRWMIPIIVVVWVIQNADLFIVNWFTSDHDAGLYRVGSRLGAGMSYLVSALLMAWTPLRRTATFAAVERDDDNLLNVELSRYFAVFVFGVLLAMAVGADALVRIAGPEYRDAAPLIPLLALGFASYGGFVVIYRGVRFPDRRRHYMRMVVLAGVIFLISALALAPPLGTEGVALAPTLGFAGGSAGLLLLARRTGKRLPFPTRRIGTALLCAAGCFATFKVLEELDAALLQWFGMAAILAYPLLLVATGAVSKREARAIARAVRRTLPWVATRRATDGLSRVPSDDRALLELLFRRRLPVSEVGSRLQADEVDVQRRLVGALRTVAGVGAPQPYDAAVGAYLVDPAPVSERDPVVHRLFAEGVPPSEVGSLEDAAATLRRAPAEVWLDGNGHSPGSRRLSVGEALRRPLTVLVAACAAVAGWLWFTGIGAGLGQDEAASALQYVDRGLGEILFGRYSENNHRLFSILTAVTTDVFGRWEGWYRVWSVVPALGAIALVVWWAWRRLGGWTALVAGAVLTVAPTMLDIVRLGRGYGLALLASAVALVIGHRLLRHGDSRTLIPFAVAGLVGAGAHPLFAVGFVGYGIALLVRRDLRLRAAATVLAVSLLTVGFYAPVLPEMIDRGSRFVTGGTAQRGPPAGLPLAVVEGATGGEIGAGPARLLAPVAELEATGDTREPCTIGCYEGVELLAYGWIPLLIAIAGAVRLWVARRGELAALLVIPVVFTYAVLSAANFLILNRFVLFLLVPLAVLLGLGLTWPVALTPPRTWLRRVAAGVVVGLTLLAAYRGIALNEDWNRLPRERYRDAAALARQSGLRPILTNNAAAHGFYWYLGRRNVQYLPQPSLEHVFCEAKGSFVFLSRASVEESVSTECLRRRHAKTVRLEERRGGWIDVWTVPRLRG